MRFRFTLTHRGSELGPLALPALSLWDTNTGSDVEWDTGPNPSVELPGVTPLGDFSEYLWVNYGFEAGVEYAITVAYTKEYISGISNPRTIRLHILDNVFATVFSETETTPPSPGGTGSITIAFTATSDCDKIAIKVADGSNVLITINSVTGSSVDPNDETVSQEINEPDGWKDATLRLQRDKDFRSLIEFFDGSFIFYGSNGQVDGGLQFIKGLEQIYGPDVSIEMLIELAPDDINFEEVFNGQLDMSLAEEMMDNKMRIPIIRNNLWAKFMNRRDTPVDLFAATDLDLNAVEEPIESIELILPSQIITYYSEYHEPYSITYDTSVNTHCIINWSEEITSDVKLFTLVRASGDPDNLRIIGLFEAPWDGDFRIQIKFFTSIYNGSNWDTSSTSRLLFYRTTNTSGNADITISFNSGDIARGWISQDSNGGGGDTWEIYTPDIVITMYRGEQLAILHRCSGDPTVFGETRLIWKADCDLATTNAITLSGEQNIDGVMTATSRVLVKNQNNKSQNGIYDTSAGAWTRATDANTIDELIGIAVYVSGGDNQAASSYIQTKTDIGTLEVDPIVFEITDNSEERLRAFPGYDDGHSTELENFIKITAKTKFRQTQQPSVLIHDAGAAILKSYGLGTPNPFYSEIMGSQFTKARQYDSDGCIWKHGVIRGLQLRGYSLADKPFFQSFNEWWKGVNPIFNLGLSYDTIPGFTINPDEGGTIEALADWDNASGSNPGISWNYATFGLPFVSVNGNGGTEGYTRGAMATVDGEVYVISTVFEIFESGVNTPDVTFICALLDSSDNELDTQTFTYNTDGLKSETFTLSPSGGNGTYFGIRIINNTTTDTKSLVVRIAVNDTISQLLLNEEFDDATIWTNEGAGQNWVVGSGEASVTFASGFSKELTQEFTGGEIGRYYLVSEFTPSGVSGGDTATLTANFYDEDDNLISTTTENISDNSTNPFHWEFDSLVPITKLKIVFELTSGTDAGIVLPFVALYIKVATEDIVVPDEDVIRVEEVDHFYDREPSILISNIRTISRKYDNDKIYNKINIGYNTWKSEDISGIDDTQTQHIYSTRFEKVGQTITLWSEFIASSLSIETTRRQTIAESTDYKFDDSTFIIALNPDDVSPDTYTPELDENFSDIDNLLDPELRYNTRLSPARNFLRWRRWFNGCLQNFLNSFYKFVRGEGNFDMVSTMIPTSPDCLNEQYDGMPLSEKQDIEVTDDFTHLPGYYEIEVPMDWEDYKTIRNNRNNAIGISLTDDNHVPMFIDVLDYQVMHGKMKAAGWTTEYLDLSVIPDTAATQDCRVTEDEGCDDALTDQLEQILVDENDVCLVH